MHWHISILVRFLLCTACALFGRSITASAAADRAAAPDATPLLTYAASHHFPPAYTPGAQYAMKKRLSQITFDLAKDPPPETDCAKTLGAKRFATLFDDLGSV